MNYSDLIQSLEDNRLQPLIECLPDNFPHGFNHGDLPGWIQALDRLPDVTPASFDIRSLVRIGEAKQCTELERERITDQLLCLQPWRKGPFELFGIDLDTEWRSDWKWDRLLPHIASLENRLVLDVGCGNGYHCWRMAGQGARLVIGADGYLLFVMQYWAIRHFLKTPPVHVLPLILEQLPARLEVFDTVFSMGVLYHRRSPIEHLLGLRDCLRGGGELVLETLIIEGEEGMSLMPPARYAGMPNVWFIPSRLTLERWLAKCGFVNIRTVDVTATTKAEQRSSPWMRYRSLEDALDPANHSLTVEGHPAPLRAVLLANKP